MHVASKILNPRTKEAYKLIHDGILALAEIERNGMRVDVDYCIKQKDHLTRRIERLEQKILSDENVKDWKKAYRNDFNLDSPKQLATVLFEHMKLQPQKVTSKGASAVDKESLDKLKDEVPFINDLLMSRKLKKTRDTYLSNLIRETVDGYIHPFFNMHTVKTFRSSSSSPNFQNIPTRDPEIGGIVRRAFIPRENCRFGGVDYGSMEVKISATYHKDPMMIKYINDHTTDMHRDVTADCYMLEHDDVSSEARKVGKNMFTFPQLYGDYYVNCAKGLWSEISNRKLTTKINNIPMLEHLHSKGITSYDKFENHIKKAEDIFWNQRFKVYKKWKTDWISDYQKKGYFYLHTGFTCQGVMSKNDATNYPVQGAAFHCLVWSLIEMHKWLKENKLKSLIVGQIHDEMVLDIYEPEMELVLAKIRQVMTIDIREAWQWINVPLEVDGKFCEVGQSWFDKKEVLF